MLRTITLVLTIAAAAAAQSTQKPASAPAKAQPSAQARSTTGPLTIPPDAVHEKDGSYTWTDKAGKKWTYRSGIFGVTRTRWHEPSVTATAQPQVQNVKVVDKGDTVRFERQEPLGNIVWEKKKTDLNADEKKLYDAQKGKAQ